jgi:RinA family phage transcriptional activator
MGENVRRVTFKYIEQEIYSLNETKKQINELTDDILLATPQKHEIRDSKISNPTYEVATVLVTSKLRTRMIETTVSIDVAFMHIPTDQKIIFEDKYFKRPHLPWNVVADLHHVASRSLFRWRKALIEDIARRMGLK